MNSGNQQKPEVRRKAVADLLGALGDDWARSEAIRTVVVELIAAIRRRPDPTGTNATLAEVIEDCLSSGTRTLN